MYQKAALIEVTTVNNGSTKRKTMRSSEGQNYQQIGKPLNDISCTASEISTLEKNVHIERETHKYNKTTIENKAPFENL